MTHSVEDNAQSANGAAFADYFLHGSFQQDPDTLHRARILVITFWFVIGIIATAILLVSITPTEASFRFIGVPLDLIIIGVIFYLLFQLKYKGNYTLCSTIAITVFLLSLVMSVCITGGISTSPLTQLLVTPPLMAYFFRGKRGGNIVSIATALFSLAMIAMEKSGFEFPQTFHQQQIDVAQALALLVQFAIVTTLALVYEYTSVTLRKERDIEHQKIMQLAQTDQLTGLANRRIFDETIARRIAHYVSQSTPHPFALCYLDLDGFKPVNDHHGHDVGDQVLRTVSIRLRSALRGTDMIGRHGGDEFMLLLDDLGNDSAITANAKRFLKLISDPMETSAGLLRIGGSLGFALYPQHATDIENLKKAADAAMYSAKREKAGWKIYDATQIHNNS